MPCMTAAFFTSSGVRLLKHSARAGDLNWLLVPGGPGMGSESLDELARTLGVPGTIWLVDLPGDSSNRMPPGVGTNPFARWPQVLLEAAQSLPSVVLVGHSTGGMYILATSELEAHVRGLALLDTAPDASWHQRFVEMTSQHPLPAVEAATAIYEQDRSDENLAAVAVASAEWNFTSAGLAAGRDLLARMPYNRAAVDWSDANFDHTYCAAWWPHSIPVLVLAGADDRIVWQGGWQHARFHGPNAIFRTIPKAGHFPWIENPGAVSTAFMELVERTLAA